MKKNFLLIFALATTLTGMAQTQENNNTTNTEKAIFASGCFWGTEFFMQKIDGIISTTVGYTGGDVDNPSYREVCGKNTGHYEAVEVVYNPAVVNYETLAKMFFETHDPTQINGQGPDIGPQYKSAIFYFNEEQKAVAQNLINTLEAKGMNIATALIPAGTFWDAESYHQDYYDNKGGTPYCHGYKKLF